ncbi:unnamed protein product [Urochloa decumbens]|uniref:DUF4220 domain-containing protein n=1 Tax=Urochloa decumbens TaxID=240449 RepID=A0ABC9FKW2_9POAL
MKATWTTLLHNAKDWWKSPRGTVVRIEVLVGLVAISMVFLAGFGSLRRRRRNFFAQTLVLGAYLSTSLVSYTLGSMQSSQVKSSMYPFWAVSLYILSDSADSITAYSLDDNSQQMRRMFQTFLCVFYVGSLAVTILNNGGGILLFFDMVSFAFLKWWQRNWACEVASGSWNLNKMVAVYMKLEHTKSGVLVPYDAATMTGYRYLVDWPLHEPELKAATLYAAAPDADDARAIHLEKIWQCKRLSSEQRDKCLSFSPFHLLRRRFFGFGCGESPRQKTHDFVFKGLLAKNDSGTIDYGRVFKVIDVELAFMNWSPVVITTTPDVVFTLVMLAFIALLEVLQLLLYWTTIWGTVHLACHSVRRREALRRTREDLAFKIRSCISNKYSYWFPQRNKCYWQNKLGQYSLVESVRYKPILSKALRAFLKLGPHISIVNSEVIYPAMNVGIRWSAGKPGKPVELSAEVKEALVQSLECTQGVLTNGQSSLRSNGAGDLSWACRHDKMQHDSGTQERDKLQVYVILTWHIATGYCELGAKARGNGRNNHLGIATKLSKYCAYLLMSEPKLLPGHHYDTRRVFEAVVEEAVELFLHNEQERYEAMRRLPNQLEENIFTNGVRLGKQLEGMEEGARWKVLADFWAEMLLYLAPSDNVKAHVECLAKGGEFITHLWALLTHAGILERDQRVVAGNDIENAWGNEPCAASRDGPGTGMSCADCGRSSRCMQCFK